VRARRVVTPRGYGHSGHYGKLTTGSTTAETQRFLKAIGHWTSAYMLLQENVGGEAQKVVLTGGADDAGKEDDTDGDSLQDFCEMPLGWF
jgi:hypothetical protein